jgi:hypothetical protein
MINKTSPFDKVILLNEFYRPTSTKIKDINIFAKLIIDNSGKLIHKLFNNRKISNVSFLLLSLALINSLLALQPSQRLGLSEICNHKWMTGILVNTNISISNRQVIKKLLILLNQKNQNFYKNANNKNFEK